MKHLYSRKRSSKARGEHSYWFRHRSILVKHLSDYLRPCPTIFELDISKFPNPCNAWHRRHLFRPASIKIDGKDFWDWLLDASITGKVKVDFYFSGWYCTFLMDDPAMQKIEKGTLRIAFSNKASAMMFKLNFAHPSLKVIRLAHS